MKPAWIVALLVILASAPASHADDGPDPATRVLVTFSDPGLRRAAPAGPARPGYSRRSSTYRVSVNVKRAANRIARDFNLLIIEEWPIVPLQVHCLVFAVSSAEPVARLLGRLRARPEVESAQVLNEFEVFRTTQTHADPYSGLQHNIDTLELAQAHAWSLGEGTSVTIIDTGADFNHPELKTQIRVHQDFVNEKGSDFATDAHGTAVAGVIAAAANNGVGMIGIAPSSRLTLLRACWYRDSASRAVCDSFTLARALSFAVESNTDVINLSLGGPPDALLDRLVNLALKRGIVVVAAAPAQQQIGFPADVPGVIVVRTHKQLSTDDDLMRFPVNAPGEEILVPVPGGGFDYASGSSLSAAHVSGIVALMVARRPDLSHHEVNTLLIDSRTTAGESVNACRALARLLQRSGCRRSSTVSQSLQRGIKNPPTG